MKMRDLTLSELERLQPQAADDTLQMDEDAFRTLYERTARPLWAYLWRRTGSSPLADDLLQEAYYRLLRSRVTHESEAHRRNYLFRIAANLANDAYRSNRELDNFPAESDPAHPSVPAAAETSRKQDLDRALATLSSRHRDALWLAYAEGASHIEIAEKLGLKVNSVKLILFRARRKIAKLLRSPSRPEGVEES
jgi:RNA polymerase sigma-70 factor (ECF subfamily)